MTANRDVKIGGILLAAGGSSRLGRPKQLLEFKGKTLIRRAAETLAESTCDPIVVVLGAEIERSTAELNGLDIAISINENWQAGMSSSIISGLRSLFEVEPELDAVVITLCDQPHVTSADFDELITAYRGSFSQVVAASFGEITGVPALFSKQLFSELLALTGDKGARQFIRTHNEIVESVEIEKAAVDIDTLDDADRLISNYSAYKFFKI